MLVLGIATAVIAITLVVLTVYAIPVLLEVRKAAEAVRTVSLTFDSEIKPVIEELRETIADIHEVTRVVAANAEGVGLLTEELGQAGQNIRTINRIAAGVSGIVSGSSLWLTGAKVAGRYIIEKLQKKRG